MGIVRFLVLLYCAVVATEALSCVAPDCKPLAPESCPSGTVYMEVFHNGPCAFCSGCAPIIARGEKCADAMLGMYPYILGLCESGTTCREQTKPKSDSEDGFGIGQIEPSFCA